MADETSLIGSILASQGLRLVAGSNITPELVLYDASAKTSALNMLGIVPYARVEDKDGRVIARYGETQQINLFLAAAYWGLAAMAVFAIVKGFKR